MNPIFITTPKINGESCAKQKPFLSKVNRSAGMYSFLAEAVTLGPITSEEP